MDACALRVARARRHARGPGDVRREQERARATAPRSSLDAPVLLGGVHRERRMIPVLDSRPSRSQGDLMRCIVALAFSASCLMAVTSFAATGPPKSKPATGGALSAATFPVERHVLKNGLVVLLHEDHTVPAVTFWQWYKVGSRNERPGITGISHFFEHMMFNGSKNVPPKEYDKIIESNGGSSNAFTTRDMTAYYEDIASDRLEVLFRLDSDRMRGLRFEPELLKSEIEVVKEERRLRTDNDISGLLDEHLYATAFMASPYAWPVVGWMGDLQRIEREEMEAYFRTYYAPNNCVLVLT